jgi:Histone methylation protein DOT1
MGNNLKKNDSILYQAYFHDVYRKLTGFQTFSATEFQKMQNEKICATYGELEYISAVKIFNIAKMTEQDIFLDLGSGNGKLVLQAFLQTAAKLCLGIEAVEKLVLQSNQVKQRLIDDMQYSPTSTHDLAFIQGNFLTTDWRKATVVYTCSTCYTKELLIDIGNKINQEATVGKVFSLKPLPTLTRLKLKSVFGVECSWDSALCFFYTRHS